MTTELRKEALSLYDAPFEYIHGYIFDAKSKMVSDNDSVDPISRVRGWGKLSYKPNGAALQDEVGAIIVDALNDYFAKHKEKSGEI
jgi:hypothetical protein